MSNAYNPIEYVETIEYNDEKRYINPSTTPNPTTTLKSLNYKIDNDYYTRAKVRSDFEPSTVETLEEYYESPLPTKTKTKPTEGIIRKGREDLEYLDSTQLTQLNAWQVKNSLAIAFPGISTDSPENTGEVVYEWDKTDTHTNPEVFKVVETGSRGSKTYIIDPVSGKPLTPGFHQIHHVDDDRIIASTHGSLFVISALHDKRQPNDSYQNPDDPLFFYPSFMYSKELVVRRLNPSKNQTGIDIDNPDPFGLEIPHDPVKIKADGIFNDAKSKVAIYAAGDKKVLAQYMDPEASVELPLVNSETMVADLHFRSFNDLNGGNSIYLRGFAADGKTENGFFIVQNNEGVVIFDAAVNKSYMQGDENFETVLDTVKTYLDRYFDALKIQGSGEVLVGLSNFELRQQLGELTMRKAAKKLQLALDTKVK